MATRTWTGGTANWNTATDWTANTLPGSSDTAYLPGASSSYTVTISAGNTDTISKLTITGGSHTTSLDILGTLTTGTLAYTGGGGDGEGGDGKGGDAVITVDHGGVFDVTSSITASHSETITIKGTTSVADLELGSTKVDSSNVTFNFSNNAHTINYGEIEYLSGYTSRMTLTQKHLWCRLGRQDHLRRGQFHRRYSYLQHQNARSDCEDPRRDDRSHDG